MSTNIMQNVRYLSGQRTQIHYKREADVILKVNNNSYKIKFIIHHTHDVYDSIRSIYIILLLFENFTNCLCIHKKVWTFL